MAKETADISLKVAFIIVRKLWATDNPTHTHCVYWTKEKVRSARWWQLFIFTYTSQTTNSIRITWSFFFSFDSRKEDGLRLQSQWTHLDEIDPQGLLNFEKDPSMKANEIQIMRTASSQLWLPGGSGEWRCRVSFIMVRLPTLIFILLGMECPFERQFELIFVHTIFITPFL